MEIPRKRPNGPRTQAGSSRPVDRFQGGVRRWGGFCLVAWLSFGSSQTLHASEFEVAPTEVPYFESQAEAAAGRRLRPILRRLEELAPSSFEESAATLLLEAPALGRDAILLQAGRPMPPGLTAARQQKRRDVRDVALAFLRSELDPQGDQAGPWLRRIESHLVDQARGGIVAGTRDLRAAAMVCAGELGLDQFIPRIAALASATPSGIVELAAQQALRSYYGRWITNPGVIDSLTPPGDPGSSLVRRAFERTSIDTRNLWLRLLALDPSTAEELFGNPDPSLRAEAARRLLSAIGKQELERDAVAATLLERVRVEAEAGALHAALAALVEIAQAAGPKAPITEQLRAALRTRATGASAYLVPVLLVGLERLPVEAVADSGATASTGDGRVASELLARLLVRGSPVDGDDMVSAIHAWSQLMERGGIQAREAGSHDCRRIVSELLLGADESVSVRMAAASALGRLQPGDVRLESAVGLLSGSSLPSGLRVAIYSFAEGALDSLHSEQAAVNEEAGGRLLQCLMRDAASDESEVRRHVVRLLGSQRIFDLAQGGELPDFTRALLDAAVNEPSAELQTTILQRIESLVDGRSQPAALRVLLAKEGATRLWYPSQGRSRALSGMFRALAGADGPTRMGAARWLVQAARESKSIGDEESGLERVGTLGVEAALRIVADLDQDQAATLAAADHREVLAWAVSLLEGMSRVSMAGTLSWLGDSLLEHHLSALDVEGWQVEWHLLNARIHASRNNTSQNFDITMEAFARFLSLSESNPRQEIAAHRDRVRYLHRIGAEHASPAVIERLKAEDSDALRIALVDSTREVRHLAADELLDITDLELLATRFSHPGLWERLVHRNEWVSLPVDTRLAHLRGRSAAALAATEQRDWQPLQVVLRSYEGFDSQAEPGLRAAESTLWRGMGDDESVWKQLAEDVKAVRLRSNTRDRERGGRSQDAEDSQGSQDKGSGGESNAGRGGDPERDKTGQQLR